MTQPTPTADPTGTPRPSARPTASPAATPASTPRPTPTRAPTTYLRYTVQVGDTLYSIAARFGSTVAAIVDANNITNAAYVRAGDILLIPR